jgi:hypothetical protein
MSLKRKRSGQKEEDDGWGKVDLGSDKFEQLDMEDVDDDEDSFVDNSNTNDDSSSDDDGYDGQNEHGEDDEDSDDVYVSDEDDDELLQEEDDDDDDDDIGDIKVLHSFDNETEEEKVERKQKQYDAQPSMFDDVDNSDDSSEDEVCFLYII